MWYDLFHGGVDIFVERSKGRSKSRNKYREIKFTFGVFSVSRLSGREENCWPGWMESGFFVALIVFLLFLLLLLLLF